MRAQTGLATPALCRGARSVSGSQRRPPGTYIPRLVDRRLSELLTAVPAVELRGPRGCGKTTTAERHARTCFYLDDPQRRGPAPTRRPGSVRSQRTSNTD